jgi:acyl-CoA thioesterase-1
MRQILRWAVAAAVCSAALMAIAAAPAIGGGKMLKIVALGDSITAGFGLPEKDSFVTRLQAALARQGIAVEVANAGVSGNTATDGLARLDWSVPDDTDAVVLELGANDMLRGIKPEVTRAALEAILRRLTERHITVLLCGMRAAPNLGPDYDQAFARIYPELAAKYGALLYPFFLEGVAGDLALNQPDGLHPNAAGVDAIVARILPKMEELIARIRAQQPS